MDVASPSLLARLESMPREEFLAFQFAKLERQLARVYAANAFYRDMWDAAGAHPDQIRSLDDVRRIPTVSKADFVADQAAHPPFGRRLGIARDDVAMVTMTSGTAGQGQEVYGRTAADIVIHAHLHWLPCHLAGLRRGDIVFNCAPTGGLTSGGWGLPDGFRHGGATAFHVGGVMSTDAKIDLMLRFGEMHFVYASTNYLHTLTEAMRRRRLLPRERFPMLRALYISAEGYSPAWAQAMEDFWGAPLHEGYGSTQAVGFALTSCPSGRSADGLRMLHALEWMNLCEVVDPATGEPVGPGEEGELILTNLDISGSPCIRFATRDRVRYFPHDACGCGRPWVCVEAGTIGRYDDMMKIRGNNVWPTAIDQLLFAQPEVAEYAGRVLIDAAGRTEVVVRVALTSAASAAAPATREDVLRRLARLLKDKTNVAMRLEEVDRAALPTFAYKSRRWQDERQQGYDRAGKGNT